MTTHTGPRPVNTRTWYPSAPARQVPTGVATSRPGQRVDGQTGAELEQAVRRAARMRTIFYAVVLLVALAGQVTGARQKLDIPLLLAIPAVGALELGGVVVMANADVRRRLGERAIASRILSAAIAVGAVAFNWLAHDNHLLGGFFAGMSALGYLVWLVHVENVRRDRLRAVGALAATTPAYELIGHWLRYPLITHRARSMARADPTLGLYGSLDAARTALRRERRNAAIVKVLRRKIRAAVDPTTATIAVHVYDLDEIAARLAGTADYDGLTDLIAADLTPARITTGIQRRKRRRLGHREAPAGRYGPEVEGFPGRDARTPPSKVRRKSNASADPTTVRTQQHSAASTGGAQGDRFTPTAKTNARGGSHLLPDSGLAAHDGAKPHPPTPAPARSRRVDGVPDGEAPSGAGSMQASKIPNGTAEAVAYWLQRDPHMGYDDIARRIGKTERTVRRNLPAGYRRPNVRNGA